MVHVESGSYDSCTSRHSSQTVIYRPNTAYFPGQDMYKFHDDESNLTFDVKTPSTRSPTKSRKSGVSTETEDSRRVSDWSQFSGFTYYTNATSDGAEENGDEKAKKEGRKRVDTAELEEIAKSLGIEREKWEGVGESEKDEEGVEMRKEEEEAHEETDDDSESSESSDGSDGDSIRWQSEADSSEITVQRCRAYS
jgi:hypothetical protein